MNMDEFLASDFHKELSRLLYEREELLKAQCLWTLKTFQMVNTYRFKNGIGLFIGLGTFDQMFPQWEEYVAELNKKFTPKVTYRSLFFDGKVNGNNLYLQAELYPLHPANEDDMKLIEILKTQRMIAY